MTAKLYLNSTPGNTYFADGLHITTQDDALLDQLGATLYGESMTFKPYERISIFYWFAALKDTF